MSFFPHAVWSRTAAAWRPFERLPRLALLALMSAGLALFAHPAGAEDPAPNVTLDDLLKLPSGIEYDVEKKGGATRDEWQRRFQAAQMELRQAKSELARSLEELDAQGGSGAWQMTPPGLGQIMQKQNQNQQTGANAVTGQEDAAASMAQGLSGQIRRQKQDVAQAERALRNLEVEANLAGVPPDWRR